MGLVKYQHATNEPDEKKVYEDGDEINNEEKFLNL